MIIEEKQKESLIYNLMFKLPDLLATNYNFGGYAPSTSISKASGFFPNYFYLSYFPKWRLSSNDSNDCKHTFTHRLGIYVVDEGLNYEQQTNTDCVDQSVIDSQQKYGAVSQNQIEFLLSLYSLFYPDSGENEIVKCLNINCSEKPANIDFMTMDFKDMKSCGLIWSMMDLPVVTNKKDCCSLLLESNPENRLLKLAKKKQAGKKLSRKDELWFYQQAKKL